MHPLVIAAGVALIMVNVFLVYHAFRHYEQYRTARTWPRIEVRADSVDVQRVSYSRQGAPITQHHYEAVVNFRYRVDAREYTKQTVAHVSDRAEAESLKSRSTLSFIYNPANPEETLEQPPGQMPLVLMLVGILVFNGIGIGLVFNLAAHFGE
jgi:hypothetical protein